MKNRRVVLPVFLLAASVIMVACSADPSKPIQSQNRGWTDLRSAAAPYRGQVVRVLGEDLPPLHSLDTMRERFEESTGIRVEIDFKNHSRVIQSVLEGALRNGSDYDLIFVPHKELGRLDAVGAMRDLSQFAGNAALKDPAFDPKQQFFEPFWSEVTEYNGKWLAMPLYLGGSVIVYRKDLVEDEGERRRFAARYNGANLAGPRNPADLLRLAEFFNRPRSSPPMYGVSLLLSEESLWYEWQSILFAFGGNVLDTRHGWEYGDIVVNSPEAERATAFYRALSRYTPPDASSYSWGLGIAKQQAGVNFMTLLQYDVVAEFENPSKTKFAGRFGYELPRNESGRCSSQLESWVGFIPSATRSAEASWLLLQWMMAANVQLQMHLEGNVSPRKSTYDDAKVKAIPAVPTILESLTCMVPKPTIPEADAIQQILTRHLQAIMSEKTTPQRGLDAAAVEINGRLSGKAKLRFPPRS